MDYTQYNHIQAHIDALAREVEKLEAYISYEGMLWVGVPSTLIPDGVQNKANDIVERKAYAEHEIAELKAKIHPYCFGILRLYGAQAHGWLQERYKTLNSDTVIIPVEESWVHADHTYYWLPPLSHSILEPNFSPVPSQQQERYLVHFDHWAYTDDKGRPVNDFWTGYVAEINHVFYIKR